MRRRVDFATKVLYGLGVVAIGFLATYGISREIHEANLVKLAERKSR